MTAYADFRFASTGDLAYLGGPASRFNHNPTAIKLLKSLEAEGRTPRRSERYGGYQCVNKLAGIKSRAPAFTHRQLVLKPTFTKRIHLDIDILDFLQAIGGALTENLARSSRPQRCDWLSNRSACRSLEQGGRQSSALSVYGGKND